LSYRLIVILLYHHIIVSLYRHIVIPLYYHIIILLYNHIVISSYCFIVISCYRYIAILLYCHIIISSYIHIAIVILLYLHIVILLYHHIVILSYHYIIILSHHQIIISRDDKNTHVRGYLLIKFIAKNVFLYPFINESSVDIILLVPVDICYQQKIIKSTGSNLWGQNHKIEFIFIQQDGLATRILQTKFGTSLNGLD